MAKYEDDERGRQSKITKTTTAIDDEDVVRRRRTATPEGDGDDEIESIIQISVFSPVPFPGYEPKTDTELVNRLLSSY